MTASTVIDETVPAADVDALEAAFAAPAATPHRRPRRGAAHVADSARSRWSIAERLALVLFAAVALGSIVLIAVSFAS